MRRFLWVLLTSTLIVGGCSRPKITPVEEISARKDASHEVLPEFVPSDSDWPMWRGIRGDGVAASTEIPTDWNGNINWQVDVPGRGHGSPTVVDGRVYLATADEKKETQSVIAFDRETGKKLWQTEVGSGGFPKAMHPKSTHANGSVACDGQHVFAVMLNHDSIHAIALTVDGAIAWEKRIGAFDSKFGYAPSPTIYGSSIILAADNQGGGYLASLHRKTGEIIWLKKRDEKSTYSSPIVANVAGKDQLLISGCGTVSSYAPTTGDLYWSLPATAEATCGTVVWNEGFVFASGGYPDEQTVCIRADDNPEIVWTNRTKIYEPSLILVGDFLYAATDRGIAHCWNVATGEEMWKKRLGGNFSSAPVNVGKHIILTSDDGKCTLIEANAEEFVQVAVNQMGDDAYATPTVCGGQIFLRVGVQQGDRQEKLICVGTPVEADTQQ